VLYQPTDTKVQGWVEISNKNRKSSFGYLIYMGGKVKSIGGVTEKVAPSIDFTHLHGIKEGFRLCMVWVTLESFVRFNRVYLPDIRGNT
jgi:hypothetical protein